MDEGGSAARRLATSLSVRGCRDSHASPDRLAYLDASEGASLANDPLPFQFLVHERLDYTLREYFAALE